MITSAPRSTFFRTRFTPASLASVTGFATAHKAKPLGKRPLRMSRDNDRWTQDPLLGITKATLFEGLMDTLFQDKSALSEITSCLKYLGCEITLAFQVS